MIHSSQTLLEALAQLFPDSSKTTLRSWLKEGRVLVDGQVKKNGNDLISAGQEIHLGSRQKFIKEGKVKILYEDRHIVVIDKPHGVLSVSTAFEKGETVHAFLKEKYSPKRVFVVHRLDQDTSGVMLFALSEQARDQLKILFEKHDLERSYIAIVEGKVQPLQGTWKSYLTEDANYYVHSSEYENGGQLAITHYITVAQSKNYSLLQLQLETGRKNQIRVHCYKAGNSIAGDAKYGASTNPIHRLCLHARLLAFSHPITHQTMRFESPIPESFQKIIGTMSDV